MMETKLVKLYNTLATVETRGESTKVMADCLRYIEQMVDELKSVQNETANSTR